MTRTDTRLPCTTLVRSGNLWRAHFQHGIRRRHLPGRNRAAAKQVEKSRQHDAAKQNYGYGTGVAPPPPIRSDILGLQTRRRGWQAGGLLHALLLDVDRARNGCSDARTAQEAAADHRPAAALSTVRHHRLTQLESGYVY